MPIVIDSNNPKAIKETVSTLKNRRNMIIENHKKIIGHYKSISNFIEPVLFLIRNDGTVEFYEDAKPGKFVYESLDDKKSEKTLTILPDPLKFPYGKYSFRGYIAQEDMPFTLPIAPVLWSEQVDMLFNKIFSDYNKWQLALEEKKQARSLQPLIIIGGIIGILALSYMLVPDLWQKLVFSRLPQEAAKNITETTTTILQNVVRVEP